MTRSGLARISLIAGIVLLLAVFATFLFQPIWLFHWSDIRTGKEVVRRVEAFRSSHDGTPPETLQEVGLEEKDLNVFYRRVDQHSYVVWFGTSLGESETYHSSTRKWD